LEATSVLGCKQDVELVVRELTSLLSLVENWRLCFGGFFHASWYGILFCEFWDIYVSALEYGLEFGLWDNEFDFNKELKRL
jgi:hypothetical protein